MKKVFKIIIYFVLIIVFFTPFSFGCCKKYKEESVKLRAENDRMKTRIESLMKENTSLQTEIGKLQQKIATLENEKIELQKRLPSRKKKN